MVSFSAITHNIFGLRLVAKLPQRLEELCATYAEIGPDILALQEVHSKGVLRLLRKLLPEMPEVCFAPRRTGGPAGGLVVFSRQRVDVVEYLPFSKRIWHAGTGFGKGALHWRTRVGDTVIEGVNAHLNCNWRADWVEPNRFLDAQRRHVERLAGFINGIGPAPLLVAGDLNIPYDTDPYWELVNGAKLSDPFEGGWPTIHLGDRGAYTLDHVLTRGFDGWAVKVERVFENRVAWPLRAKLCDHSDESERTKATRAIAFFIF